MKKLLFLLAFVSTAACAQQIGFNGAGFFENYSPDVETWIRDLQVPFTLRVPGGSISKFTDPYTVRKGWGMTEDNIRDWFAHSGFDEDGSGLDKWLRKASEQPDHSYMDDLIQLQKECPQMTVLYVLNILNSTPEKNMDAIRYLMQNGVRIVGVEAGNEVYGKYKSFDDYRKDFEPLFTMLRKEYPDIKKGLVAGANISRGDLQRWNRDLANYKGDYDAVILHYYYTQRELGDAYSMIPDDMTYTPGTYNAVLDNAFRKAYQEMMQKDILGDGVAYAKKTFPGKEIWITEWNTKPADKLNNTLLNGAWQFKEMVALRGQVAYLLMHNGVGPDKYAMISRKTKFDDAGTSMVRRVAYWSFELASSEHDGIECKPGGNYALQPGADGKAYLYFINLDKAYNPSVHYGDNTLQSASIHYISGKFLYSSAGVTGFMGKGQEPSYEIQGIQSGVFDGTVPENAYGYIEFTFR